MSDVASASRRVTIEGTVASVDTYVDGKLVSSGLSVKPVQSSFSLLVTLAKTLPPAFASSPSPKRETFSEHGKVDRIAVLLSDDWATTCLFVAPGDELSTSKFRIVRTAEEVPPRVRHVGRDVSDVLAIMPKGENKKKDIAGSTEEDRQRRAILQDAREISPLLLEAVESSELTVWRRKKILINCSNVGKLDKLDLTDRDRAAIRGMSIGPSDANHFCSMAHYYDIIFGQKEKFDVQFRLIERCVAQRSRLLDAGCGTGLYAFGLRNVGMSVVCLDASTAMVRLVEEKNHFFTSAGERRPPLRIHQADLTNFNLMSPDAHGDDDHATFEAALCLDVLPLLPTVEAVSRALAQIALHVALGGVLVVSFWNSESVMRAETYQSMAEYPMDNFKLCYGATTRVPKGVLHVVQRARLLSYIPASSDADVNRSEDHAERMVQMDRISRRVTQWIGSAFHDDPSAHSMFADFTESVTELILDGGKIESLLSGPGSCWKVEGLYGDLNGAPFESFTSPRRVYTLLKIQPSSHSPQGKRRA